MGRARRKPAFAPLLACALLALSTSCRQHLAGGTADASAAQGSPMEIVLASAGRIGPSPATYTARLTAGALATGGSALLRVQRLEVEGGGPAVVRVFVGLPSATSDTGAADPHQVGVISVLGAGGSARAQDFTIAIPAAALTQATAAGELAVTLVSVDGDGKPASAAIRHGKIFVR